MSETTAESQVEELAESFVARFRQGERPAISDYTRRYPELAQEIEEVFPALVAIEQAQQDFEACGPAPIDVPVPPAVSTLGDFRIIREIGRGGMGIVYEAEQVSLGRRVALKVLAGTLLANDRNRRRFSREARAAAQLHHTNIVPVFGVGEQDDVAYYVMQLIHGIGLDEVLKEVASRQTSSAAIPELRPQPVPVSQETQDFCRLSASHLADMVLSGQFDQTVLQQREESSADADLIDSDTASQPRAKLSETAAGRLSDTKPQSVFYALPGRSTDNLSVITRKAYWESVARVGLQVAEALQYAHEQGIYHRDIKPANLLLDTHGTVWVTDFGLAKATDQQNLTHTGDVVGTLRYMAPEQFEGRGDGLSDIYSLGLTLYELLALRPAFDQSERQQLLKAVTSESPPPLQTLDIHIPRDLTTIVQKVIEREPSHRYANAGELADDLQRFLNDEPIHARRVSILARLHRWRHRNPAVAGLTTAVGLLLTATALLTSIAAVKFQNLAEKNGQLAGQVRSALTNAEENLTLAAVYQQRAEKNLDLALSALDAVYLDAIGTDKLLREPIAQPVDLRASGAKPRPLSDLEKQLLDRGLRFYDEFARENSGTSLAAMQTAQAYYRVGVLQSALGDHTAAVPSYQDAVKCFEELVRQDPQNVEYRKQLVDAYRQLGLSLASWPEAKAALEKSREALTAAIELRPGNAHLYLKRANISKLFGDHRSAFADVEEARRRKPDDLPILDAAIDQHLRSVEELVDYDKAMALAQHRFKLAPEDFVSHLKLASVYSTQEDRVGSRQIVKDFTAARRHISRAIELAPDKIRPYIASGALSMQVRDYPHAITEFEHVLEQDPDNGWALQCLAMMRIETGEYDQALKLYADLLQLHPNDNDIYFRRAEAYKALERWDECVSDLSRTIDINPHWPTPYKRRAGAYAMLGRYDEAVSDLKHAAELSEENSLFAIFMESDEFKKTPKTFQDAVIALAGAFIEQFPKAENRYLARGRLLYSLDMLDRAEADYLRAAEINPQDASPYWLLGNLEKRRGRKRKAQQMFAEGIQRDPDGYFCLSNHGRISYELGDYQAALGSFDRLMKKSPRDGDSLAWRAATLLRLKRYDESLADRQKAVKLEPNRPELLFAGGMENLAKTPEKFQQDLLNLAEEVSQWPNVDKSKVLESRAELEAAIRKQSEHKRTREL